MYDKAFRAFDAANYVRALKELDAIDARKLTWPPRSIPCVI